MIISYRKNCVYFVSIAIVFIGLLFQSCFTPRVVRKSFTYCYDGKETGLDKLINIKGYYRLKYNLTQEQFTSKTKWDTLCSTFIFFSNGLFVYEPYIVRSVEIPDKDKQPQEIKSKKKQLKWRDTGGTWGIYHLCNDTIKIQVIQSPGGMAQAKIEFWFKIIDKNNLQQLYSKYRLPVTSDDVLRYLQKVKEKDLNIYTYTPLTVFPNTNKNWLIKKKWFWCNKEDWKIYKKSKNK